MASYTALWQNRRSIRDFKDKKISWNVLQEILNDTCFAPSASNQQPWRFIIIQDQTVIKKISDESKKNLLEEIAANPKSSMARYEKLLRSRKNLFYNAPCLVLIVGTKENSSFLYRDCSLAAAYFMFAATARNLGTCWIGLGDRIEDINLKKEIGLSDEYTIVAPIIIGYPKKIPTASERAKPIILKNIA